MEVIAGKAPGGHVDCMFCVEVKGENYARHRQSGPILPMFKTAVPTHELPNVILSLLVPGKHR